VQTYRVGQCLELVVGLHGHGEHSDGRAQPRARTSCNEVELVALACSLNKLSLLRLLRMLPSFFTAAAEGDCVE
jgi:hypothetical protein